MKNISRTYIIGNDLIVKLGINGDRVDSALIERTDSPDVILEAEIIDRVSKLIEEVNNSITSKYTYYKVCIDHGYFKESICEKCDELKEK